MAAVATLGIVTWRAVGTSPVATTAGAVGNSGTGYDTVDVLGRVPQPGGLRLVAFLATQPDTVASSSRSQAVGLVSLATQYGRRGLTTQIVDESGAGHDALVNTYYDWDLGSVQIVADSAHDLARRYSVTGVPAVLLLDAAGTVVQRWDAAVPTVRAAQAVAARLPG